MGLGKRALSAEQVELLHHVELSQAGWQERVVDQFVLSICLSAETGISEADIQVAVSTVIELSLGTEQVRRSIQRLKGAGKLVELDKGRLCAAETIRNEVSQARESATLKEAAARAVWESLLERSLPEMRSRLDWGWCCERVIGPLIRAQGVRVYELLKSGASADTARQLMGFLDELPAEVVPAARRVVEDFLASRELPVREFVLRRLHAYLLSLAVGLPAGSLDAFQGPGKKQVQLKLFLDTNFVFSVLGLHENPANEAAEDLVNLLADVKANVNATLYVTPLTIDEIRRTLVFYKTKLEQVPLTPKLGQIASGLDGEFSGIAMKYFEAVKQAKKRISSDEYLGPYLSDLIAVIRGHGIELYNENLDEMSTSQAVVDDILEQQAFEEGNTRRKGKSYEALRHDVTMWHLVRNRRPARVDAPLDAVYWIATVDYRLLGFDSYKRRHEAGGVPACVHPATLVQMLQLWLPRSAKMDAALFDSLRSSIPNLFDSDAEEMSLRILRALSRYEDVDDLPESTLTSILMNQALRARMLATPEQDEQIQLVKDEIVQAASAARAELLREQERVAELQKELETLQSQQSAALEHQGSRRGGRKASNFREPPRNRTAVCRGPERAPLWNRSDVGI